MLLGGEGESSDVLDVYEDNIVDIDPREKKTRIQHYIYARQDTVDGGWSAGDYLAAGNDFVLFLHQEFLHQ